MRGDGRGGGGRRHPGGGGGGVAEGDESEMVVLKYTFSETTGQFQVFGVTS